MILARVSPDAEGAILGYLECRTYSPRAAVARASNSSRVSHSGYTGRSLHKGKISYARRATRVRHRASHVWASCCNSGPLPRMFCAGAKHSEACLELPRTTGVTPEMFRSAPCVHPEYSARYKASSRLICESRFTEQEVNSQLVDPPFENQKYLCV